MTLAQVIHRIVQDATFAAQLQRDPQLALAATGLKLDRKELAALSTILSDNKLCQELHAPSMDDLEPLQGWV